MFRFANIEMLWWLITTPVFVIAYIIYTKHKRRQLMEFGDQELVAQLMPDASKGRPIWKFSLLLLAWVLLIVAGSRPQYGQQEKTIKRQGIDQSETMAFGDGENDMEMLEFVQLGVAMGNAPDCIKAVADAVTETNENDGAAIAIERYVLNL